MLLVFFLSISARDIVQSTSHVFVGRKTQVHSGSSRTVVAFFKMVAQSATHFSSTSTRSTRFPRFFKGPVRLRTLSFFQPHHTEGIVFSSTACSLPPGDLPSSFLLTPSSANTAQKPSGAGCAQSEVLQQVKPCESVLQGDPRFPYVALFIDTFTLHS